MNVVLAKVGSKLAQVFFHHRTLDKSDLKPNKITIKTFRKTDMGKELQSFDSTKELFASWKK